MAELVTKAKDARALAPADIRNKVEELRRHLFDLRSQGVTENLKDSTAPGKARKSIARLLTVLGEKDREGKPAAPRKLSREGRLTVRADERAAAARKAAEEAAKAKGPSRRQQRLAAKRAAKPAAK